MTLRLAQLAEILDRPQAAQRGIEKCQQVREEHVVQEQFSVAVSVFFIAQCLHVPRQFAYQPAPFHFLRPQGQDSCSTAGRRFCRRPYAAPTAARFAFVPFPMNGYHAENPPEQVKIW